MPVFGGHVLLLLLPLLVLAAIVLAIVAIARRVVLANKRKCPACREWMRCDASLCPHCRTASEPWTPGAPPA